MTRASAHRVEHRLGVAAEAEGRVDQDGALAVEGGRQQGDDPVEEDRDVGGGSSSVRPCRPEAARSTSAAASATEVAAEKAISATASRAWWRTRRRCRRRLGDRRDAHGSRPFDDWC